MFRLLLVFMLLGGGYYYYTNLAPIKHPPGILVAAEPLQESVNGSPIAFENYTILPLASYNITARVLSTHHYDDTLVPYDLALGWQEMSDSAVLDRLDISQIMRFYQYSWQGAPPVAREIMVRTSANTHIIPANEEVRKQLPGLRRGDIINMKGYLVRVTRPDGWSWQSSLTRTDSGNGGCELLYAQSLSRMTGP